MGETTKIQWTDKTFNPWWGCTKVGPGCDHCYADAFDRRTGGAHWGTGVPRRRTSSSYWDAARRWERNAQFSGERPWVFCGSMCDVFDNEIDPAWRTDLFGLIGLTPHLRWQLLTKRIGNAAKMLPPPELWQNAYQHVGIMATVVNQEEADRDIPKLLALKESHRVTWVGLSCEPLLGPTDLRLYMPNELWDGLPSWKQPELDWVIVGGESGPQSRPFVIGHAREIVHQCQAANVPVFVKQLGAQPVNREGQPHRLRDRKGGDITEFPPDLQIREMPRFVA